MMDIKENEINTDVTKEAYILFELEGTTYGIQSRFVQKIEMLESITPVPNAPQYVDGVMFSRGQVIPVINLRTRLGMGKKEYDLRTRVVVVRYRERITGLIVDSAREYMNIPSGIIQPAPQFITGLSGTYLEGIARMDERIVLIFNAEGILKNEDQTEINNKV